VSENDPYEVGALAGKPTTALTSSMAPRFVGPPEPRSARGPCWPAWGLGARFGLVARLGPCSPAWGLSAFGGARLGPWGRLGPYWPAWGTFLSACLGPYSPLLGLVGLHRRAWAVWAPPVALCAFLRLAGLSRFCGPASACRRLALSPC
jgi:hypothetical protein